jgi:pyruvate/2-oxoglutarate dehydrogenase complex dihydrolipoamide acyltransferase (E2) component
MQILLTMPQFGEAITQGRIVKWLKKSGDAVTEGEPLAEMETEKTLFAYESPFRGKLLKTLRPDDAEVKVGEEIASFEVSDEDGKKYLSFGIGRSLDGAKASASGGPPPPVSKPSVPEKPFVSGGAVAARPNARPQGTRIPLSPIRARIADNMVLSKQKIPHAATGLDVDLSNLPKPYFPQILLAVVAALKENPALNSSFKEEEGKRWIEQYPFIHLGIATATDQGLLVPVIRNAEKLSFEQISAEMTRLVEEGRKGGLKPQELSGGTFTVNNTGALGAIRSEQIIPYPQAAILAVNRVMRRPWVVGEAVEIRPILSLDLSFDHRIIDGDLAVKFLLTIRDKLEHFNAKT